MSALAPVVHSPLIVFTVWEIGHDSDTQGDHDCYWTWMPLNTAIIEAAATTFTTLPASVLIVSQRVV
jgi:hypothetical protein